MIFWVFLVVVALGLALWAIRSPLVRQLRRGHGSARAPFSSSNDHGLGHSAMGQMIDIDKEPPGRSD